MLRYAACFHAMLRHINASFRSMRNYVTPLFNYAMPPLMRYAYFDYFIDYFDKR